VSYLQKNLDLIVINDEVESCDSCCGNPNAISFVHLSESMYIFIVLYEMFQVMRQARNMTASYRNEYVSCVLIE